MFRKGRVLLKPEQLKYAELVAQGESPAAAYGMAFGGGEPMKPEAKRKGASRMSQNVTVQAEIARIRSEAEKMLGGAVMTLAMKRAFLFRVMNTPISEIGPDSVLCAEVTVSEPYKKGDGDQMELWEVKKIKKPDPLRAMEIDAKLAGEFAEDKTNGKLAEEMGGLLSQLAAIRKRRSSNE